MNLAERIKEAMKENKIVYGYRKVLKFIRNNKVETVILSNNAPEKVKRMIMNSNVKVEIFEGGSKEMGTICGKPYPISVIAIKV